MAPPLKYLTNGIMHQNFIAIIQLCEYFAVPRADPICRSALYGIWFSFLYRQ